MIRLAIQKSGRLSEGSLELLQECGIKINNGNNKLKAQASNFPIEILYLRDDDIPHYVETGVADIGIVGENIIADSKFSIDVTRKLGFAGCRLSLAIPKNESVPTLLKARNIAVITPKSPMRLVTKAFLPATAALLRVCQNEIKK